MLKYLEEHVKPTRQTEFSAGVDLCALKDYSIAIGQTVIIDTGVYIDKNQINALGPVWKSSHYFLLEPRSSYRVKGLISGSGIIDCDYTGPNNTIKLIATFLSANDSINNKLNIAKGDRIAQLLCHKHSASVLDMITSNIRTGGLGSTS